MLVMMDSMETEAAPASPSRQPAPGDLHLVQELVNSYEPDTGVEHVEDAPTLGRWLVAHGVLTRTDARALTERDRTRLLALREALRELLAVNGGAPLDRSAAAVLDAETRRVRLHVGIDDEGSITLRGARGGVDGVVARLLAAIATASVEGTWRRLKVCRDDTCRWAFYDCSRNASSAWCSMASCGNRAKARRHRERRRQTAD